MSHRVLTALSLIFVMSGCAAEEGGAGSIRVATYNIESAGTAGSEQHDALLAVIGRIDADILTIQEIDGEVGEPQRMGKLASRAGYPYSCISEVSGTLSGHLHTAILSRHPIVQCTSWSSAELSGDPDANDITRDILEAHVATDEEGPVWGIFTVHLKGGGGDAHKFRRQIEIFRVVRALETFADAHPASPVVLTGDFNEDIGDGPFGRPVFENTPGGLPRTYRLGPDIGFPVSYDPFETIGTRDLSPLTASHEDDPKDISTRMRSWRRLDYLLVSENLSDGGAEVYDSCDDNGVDDPSGGRPLPKTGPPLRCKLTGEAADHFPVFADLVAK